MADPFATEFAEGPPEGDKLTFEDPRTEKQRLYARTREYAGCSIDQIVNSSNAKGYMRQLWLLGCLVRQPRKALRL